MIFFLFLEIPLNVQRCCTRCYDRLISEIRKRQSNQQLEEDDDDNDEPASDARQSSKQDDGNSLFACNPIGFFFFNFCF